MNICEYCNKTFSSKNNLLTHQRTAQYCLNKQKAVNTVEKFVCEYCEQNFLRESRLKVHLEKCTEKTVDYLETRLNNSKSYYERQLKLEKEKYEKEKALLIEENKWLKNELEETQKDRDLHRDKYLIKIGELKATPCSFVTNTNNISGKNNKNNKNNNTNTFKVHPKLAKIPIDNIDTFSFEYFQRKIKDANAAKVFAHGINGMAHFIRKMVTLDTVNGLERNLACTDSSRGKFHTLEEQQLVRVWIEDAEGYRIHDILDALRPLCYKYFDPMKGNLTKEQAHILCGINQDRGQKSRNDFFEEVRSLLRNIVAV